MNDDLQRDLEPHDADELIVMAETLRANRPVPAAGFRGELRRHLLRHPAAAGRPARLWARIAAPIGSGGALLALAAAGVAGAGPFAS